MAKKSFIASTLILIFTGLIIKGLGFFYRIYLSNLIGAEGMGLFQLISPVYSTIILTLTAGISVGVSRITAKELGKGNYVNTRKITLIGLLIVTVVGAFISIVMYMNRYFITDIILKDSRTYLSIVILIPLIPIIAASSAIKGYFYGVQDVIPSAISQIIEQIVKMTFVMFIARTLAQKSITVGCAVAIGGTALGEIACFIFIVLRYKFYPSGAKGGSKSSALSILRELLSIAIPVSSTRLITSAISTLEVILIPRMLVVGGLSYQLAMKEYGRLMGMAIPLIYMPSIITSALSIMLVPVISESLSAGKIRTMRHRTSKAIKLTIIAGCILSAVFMTFSQEIGALVYKQENIGHILYLLAFTCVFVYLQQTLLGIMNGLGKQGTLFVTSIIASLIRIIFVYFLVPRYGIAGYIWGMTTSLVIVCVINLWTVASCTGITIDITDWMLKPAIITAFLLPFGRYFYHVFDIFKIDKNIRVILGIGTQAGAIGLIMIALGVIRIGELLELLYITKR